jgi:hypothetical protein
MSLESEWEPRSQLAAHAIEGELRLGERRIARDLKQTPEYMCRFSL